jgi:hypothetical protein
MIVSDIAVFSTHERDNLSIQIELDLPYCKSNNNRIELLSCSQHFPLMSEKIPSMRA